MWAHYPGRTNPKPRDRATSTGQYPKHPIIQERGVRADRAPCGCNIWRWTQQILRLSFGLGQENPVLFGEVLFFIICLRPLVSGNTGEMIQNVGHLVPS
jgi:hypothetical protein